MKSNFDAAIDELVQDPIIKEAYDRQVRKVQVARIIYESRINAGLTQLELAKRLHTKQTVISRLESSENDSMPNLDTLIEIVHACNKRLVLGTDDATDDANIKNERLIAI